MISNMTVIKLDV